MELEGLGFIGREAIDAFLGEDLGECEPGRRRFSLSRVPPPTPDLTPNLIPTLPHATDHPSWL